jgi:hypothetical protein
MLEVFLPLFVAICLTVGLFTVLGAVLLLLLILPTTIKDFIKFHRGNKP